MNLNNKKLILILVSLFVFSTFSGGGVFACDTCGGRSPGSTWCDGTTMMECVSCSGPCIDRTTGNWTTACTEANTNLCDVTCFTNPHQYTRSTGASCALPDPLPAPRCTGAAFQSTTNPLAPISGTLGTVYAYAYGVTNVTGANSGVRVGVWNTANGQDDLVWYNASDMGGGTWRVSLPFRAHTQGANSAGTYISMHWYMYNADNPISYPNTYCSATDFNLIQPSSYFGLGGYSNTVRTITHHIGDTAISAHPKIVLNGTATDNTGLRTPSPAGLEFHTRACNASNSNCVPGSGGWLNVLTDPDLTVSGACNNTTPCNRVATWNPSVSKLSSSNTWQLVSNAYDIQGFRCSGNGLDSATRGDEDWPRCDRSTSDGVTDYDRAIVNLNDLPYASITHSIVTSGGEVSPAICSGGTCSITVRAGTQVNFIVDGADNTLDANNLQSIRLAVRNTTNLTTQTSSFACSGNSCNNVFSWTFNSPNSFTVYPEATDTTGASCIYGFNTWDRCTRGATYGSRNRAINVNVVDTNYVLPVTLQRVTSACNSPSSISGSVAGTFTMSTATPGTTLFTSPTFTVNNVNGTISQVCATITPPSTDESYSLSCASYGSTNIATVAGNCITLVPAISYPGVAGLTLGFVYNNAPAWFTSLRGDVFSNGGATRSMPGSPQGAFDGFLVDNPGATTTSNGFAFAGSGGTFDITSGGSNRLTQDAGGSVSNTNFSNLWPSGFLNPIPVPSGATTISNFSSSLNPANAYQISVSNLNTVLAAGTVNYTVSSANSVVIVYVTGSGTINVNNPITTAGSGRIVFVTNNPVSFATTVGTASPTTAAAAQVMSGFITTSTIAFPGRPTNDDTTIVIEGPVVAQNDITLGRNRGGSANAFYPAEVFRMASGLWYSYLTSSAATSGLNPTGLLINNVTWLPDR